MTNILLYENKYVLRKEKYVFKYRRFITLLHFPQFFIGYLSTESNFIAEPIRLYTHKFSQSGMPFYKQHML
jgi:hypothetical protein